MRLAAAERLSTRSTADREASELRLEAAVLLPDRSAPPSPTAAVGDFVLRVAARRRLGARARHTWYRVVPPIAPTA